MKKIIPKNTINYTLKAGNMRWKWQDKKSGSTRSFHKERMESIKNAVNSDLLKVISVEKKSKKIPASGSSK